MSGFGKFLMRAVGAGLLALALLHVPLKAAPLSLAPQPRTPAAATEIPTALPKPVEPEAVAAPVPAPAQSVLVETVAPPAPVYEPQSLAGREKINVVIFGDSLGDGMWAGLYHQLRSDKRFNVIRKSKVATGFVRQDYFNWNDEVAEVAANTRIDIAIVMMGTNDRQTIVDGAKRYALFEPKWREIYAARIDAFTATLQKTGAHIFWVQLPVMRQARFEADMASLNDIFAARARANGIAFIETRNLAIDENGAYTAYGEDLSGKKRLLRTEDGIHFTMAGYELIASPVTARIEDAAGTASSYQVAQAGTTAGDVTGSVLPAQARPRVDAQSLGLKPQLYDMTGVKPGRSDDWRWGGDTP